MFYIHSQFANRATAETVETEQHRNTTEMEDAMIKLGD